MGWRPFIAVIDDEESIGRAFARMLGRSRFDVGVFASGRAFLDSIVARIPDCIVLDLQMPDLTGREIQRRLASAQVRAPIIIVTAHDQPATRVQCLADGAVAYLAKPLHLGHFIETIEAAVGQPTAG